VSTTLVYLLAASALFGLGVHGVLVAGHLLRKLLALNLLGGPLDPVPQALVLTGIVVAVSATAFALALMLALYRRSGSAELDASESIGEEADDGPD